MVPVTNGIKVCKCMQGLISGTKNFAFEVKGILGLENTQMARGLT